MTVSINGTSGIVFNDASSQNMYQNIFDYQDGKLFWKKTKRLDLLGKEINGVNSEGYIYVKLHGKTKSIHRIIFEMINGYEPKLVDHINGNKKDNRIENLREVTRSQNSCNVSNINKDGTIKNVTWHKINKKWNVRITKNYKPVFSYLCDDIEFAELVAIEARNKYHGAFARS